MYKTAVLHTLTARCSKWHV